MKTNLAQNFLKDPIKGMTLKSAPDKSLYFLSDDDDDEIEPTFGGVQAMFGKNASNPIQNTFLGLELGDGII